MLITEFYEIPNTGSVKLKGSFAIYLARESACLCQLSEILLLSFRLLRVFSKLHIIPQLHQLYQGVLMPLDSLNGFLFSYAKSVVLPSVVVGFPWLTDHSALDTDLSISAPMSTSIFKPPVNPQTSTLTSSSSICDHASFLGKIVL